MSLSGVTIIMKVVKKILLNAAVVVLTAAVIVCGSLVCVFFAERSSPEDIFLSGYAFAMQKREDGGSEMWLLKKANCSQLSHADGAVYYEDGKYRDAVAKVDGSGQAEFFDSDELSRSVSVTDENVVGRIIAQWDF